MLAQDIPSENHFKKFYRIIFKVLLLQVIQQNKVSVLHINLVLSIYFMMKWCIEPICEHFINLWRHLKMASCSGCGTACVKRYGTFEFFYIKCIFGIFTVMYRHFYRTKVFSNN